jgi:7-cyano-7-deazaguanine reductase
MKKISDTKINLLETFNNSYSGRNYLIVHETSEFTSVCPKTGQPDFGTIKISYVANKKCVELKSLKLYLQSFRNDGIFYENVINKILDDLVHVLNPRCIEVKGTFTARGGIHSIVTANHGKQITNSK